MSGKEAKWYSHKERVTVQGCDIPGMVYVGERLAGNSYSASDACLINPKLRVTFTNHRFSDEEIGYYPHYADLSPASRGQYLEWLASGRKDPDTDLSYIFLFFYGLERRILIDAQKGKVSAEERNAMVKEIQRLLSIYGHSRSFTSYATNLLETEWILYRQNKNALAHLNLQRKNSQVLPFLIALYGARKTPLPADIAYVWAKSQLNPSVVFDRHEEELRVLFAYRYQEEFGDGVVVASPKHLRTSYFPASGSLREFPMEFKDLPDPAYDVANKYRVEKTLGLCLKELEAYSRYSKKYGSSSLAALALLPDALGRDNPHMQTLTHLLTTRDLRRPFDITALYRALEQPEPSVFSRTEAEQCSLILQKLGYGFAPDVRVHKVRPLANHQTFLFTLDEPLHSSAEFEIVSTLVRLGAIIVQADKTTLATEKAFLRKVISANDNLVPVQKKSLLAFLAWCLANPPSVKGVKQQLALLTEKQKRSLGYLLISTAHTNGQIQQKEMLQLEKMYKALGLDKKRLPADVQHVLATANVVTVSLREPEKTFTIPKENAEEPEEVVEEFALNEEIIRLHDKETQEVQELLKNIFQTVEEEPDKILDDETIENDGLDLVHRKLLVKLLEQESWEAEEVYALCSELDLMMDGALETLNDWAIDKTGEVLVEDAGTIYIDTDLGRELVNEKN